VIRSTERFNRGDSRCNNRNRRVAELFEEWFKPTRSRKAIGIEKRNKRCVDLGKTSVAGCSWATVCCAANARHARSMRCLRRNNNWLSAFVIDHDDASGVADAIEQTRFKFAAHRNNDCDIGSCERCCRGNRLQKAAVEKTTYK
jgi:hypothetical protein